jgi:hypothetical protein
MFFAKRGLRFLLAALLVFSQQQAVLHLLGHDLAQLSQKSDSSDPSQELVCAKCLAIAHLDHAVSPSVPVILPVRATPVAIEVPAPRALDVAFVAAYRSRAPPVLS